MRLKDNHKGFSLIEMVIVFGIMAIVAGISIRVINYLKLANSEKAVKTIEGALSKQQANAMSKADRTYLYIYEIDDVYYVCSSKLNKDALDPTFMNKSNGVPLGAGMTIYSIDPLNAKTKIAGTTILKVSYKRDGTFDFDGSTDSYRTIHVQTKIVKEIKLIRETGRYIVKDSDPITGP